MQVIESNDPWGRVATSLGQGIGKAMDTRLQQQRLSQGLAKLKTGMQSGQLSEPDLIAQIYSMPGMKPELAAPLLQAYQNQIANQAFLGEKQPGITPQATISPQAIPGAPVSAEQPRPSEYTPEQDEDFRQQYGFSPSSLTTGEQVRTALATRPVITPQMIDAEARRLMTSDRRRFNTIEKAQAQAERNLNIPLQQFDERLAAQARAITVGDQIDAGLKQKMEKVLQKEGPDVYPTISGEFQQRWADEIKDKVLRGEGSPEKLTTEYATKALAVSKARTGLQNLGTASWVGAESPEFMKTLKTYRQRYEDLGILDAFQKDLQRYNQLGQHLSAAETYPVSGEINKSFAELQKEKRSQRIKAGVGAREDFPFLYTEQDARKIASKIGENLSADDSIPAIVLKAHELGLDDEQVSSALKDLYNKGNLKLNKRQEDELSNIEPVTYGMPDLFWAVFGKGKYKDVSWSHVLRHNILGKR